MPRKYLQSLPELPKTTNLAIIGPRKSGKKTIANLLSSIYGFKIINIQ
jgi:predicted AAA+ superfamily ATPase